MPGKAVLEAVRQIAFFCQTGRDRCIPNVTPAKAGVQKSMKMLDSRLRGNDNTNSRSFGKEL
jgi:hypothetical protein